MKLGLPDEPSMRDRRSTYVDDVYYVRVRGISRRLTWSAMYTRDGA